MPLKRFWAIYKQDQAAVTSIEYGLIVMAIALACMTAYFLAGDAVREMVFHASSTIETATSIMAEE
ncbi:MAG: Flp family type IVb pilin [Micavibrio aeruginosavorus]|uniref:Flp family type IVb pilin n=1 Tax=Micavibrio aeruginosavorus TaxID=349221 RepID=A0A7T5R4P1_9BACT|nr:MAG: Flp family type IVb pilin [Micavibrio aeruginosavorus]